jgi:hypothetical protein
MAYDDNGRLRSEDELRANNQGVEVTSNARYIVGGIAVLAIIFGVLFIVPHNTNNEAINGRPAATTTGAGSTSPAGRGIEPSMPTRPAPPAAPGAPATR